MSKSRAAKTGRNIAGVQFRRAGKIYDFDTNNMDVTIGDYVIVDSERGQSIAQVVKLHFLMPEELGSRAIKPIVRRAGKKELAGGNRLQSDSVVQTTQALVKKHKLKMRVLTCESQFGGSKMIIYFTSPGRVDFRELVRELASQLKTRIELKQVGARDEAKLLGGIGICGREYCCSSFLREFVPVSIRMAKNQNLAINPSKVSGGCGRLLCCLTYEDSTYSSLRRKLPPKGALLHTKDGMNSGKVIRTDLLNQLVTILDNTGGEHTLSIQAFDLEEKYAQPQENIAPLAPEAVEWAESLDLEALEAALASAENKPSRANKSEGRKHNPTRSNERHARQAEGPKSAARSKGKEKEPKRGSTRPKKGPEKGNAPKARKPGNPPKESQRSPNASPGKQGPSRNPKSHRQRRPTADKDKN
ncbi:MAG: regulatory iron-sulfur-containing complex subunit RicT [Zetaproteobacteria bacterium]|nr:regulatory iron-sulfur-containing complex subunit RicT [Zetaproteobacteria bacterium]